MEIDNHRFRLGRLKVTEKNSVIHVTTSNIHRFSFRRTLNQIVVDGTTVELRGNMTVSTLVRTASHSSWQVSAVFEPWMALTMVFKASVSPVPVRQISGRLQRILSCNGPLLIVADASAPHYYSVALRIVHDLHNYHRLDAEIISGTDALRRRSRGELGKGNIVVVGHPQEAFAACILSQRKTPFGVQEGSLTLNGMEVDMSAIGVFDLVTCSGI